MTITKATRQVLDEGYALIESWDLFEPGVRVYSLFGQQYFEAAQYGTATILAVFQKEPSTWAQKCGRPDIEFIVQRDDKSIVRWADYHIGIARNQEARA